MRSLFKLVLVLGLLAGGVWVWGRSMPREHRVGSSVTLVASPDSVFALLSDIKRMPTWWREVESVRRLTGRRRESWEQVMRGTGPVQMEITSISYGERMVTTILNDEQQDWGGRWIYTVDRTAAGTEVRIVEEGWVDPPLFRVMMKMRGGPHRLVDSHLRSLAAHVGESVTPRHLDAP